MLGEEDHGEQDLAARKETTHAHICTKLLEHNYITYKNKNKKSSVFHAKSWKTA